MRRSILPVLLAAVVLAVLWFTGFFNLFSAPVKKVKGNKAKFTALMPENHLRHEIYDRDMNILALSLRMYSAYVRPLEMEKGQKAVARLVKLLGIKGKKIERQLRTKRSLVWLKRYIGLEDAKKIAALNLKGVYLVRARSRLYPHGRTAAQVIGFVKEEQGLAGTEFVYDNLLRGDWPMEPVNRPPSGIDYRGIPASGAAVVLNLELKLQSMVEEKLTALMKKNGAQSGMAVLMNADNGEILAMANLPDYDPNHYWNFSSFNRRNRVDSDPVYLGGLAAYFRLAAAVQAGNISAAAGDTAQDVRSMAPRRMKRLPGGALRLKRPVWQRARDGIYRWPYINEADAPVGSDQLARFVRQLGVGKIAENNVLADQSATPEPFTMQPMAQITPLDLAVAVARTINDGRTFTPHLLHGVWLGADKGEIRARFVSSDSSLFPNGEFLNFLRRHLGPDSAKPLVLESLVAMREKAVADIDFAGDSAAGQIVENNSDEAEAKLVEASGIGIYTAGSAPLVLVMSLDGVRRALPAKAIFGRAMNEIFAYTSRHKAKTGKDASSISVGEMQRFKRQWRKIHLKTRTLNHLADHDDAPLFMPRLKGFSLRKSLQTLSGHDLHIRIIGAGQVLRQTPRAGVPLKNGQNCRLELRYKDVRGTDGKISH